MPAVAGHYALAQVVCKALGLDPENVRRITLDFDRDGTVLADVTMYPQPDAVETIGREIRQYYLVPRSET